jgi:4-carboxymuconolactone decarboxylase
VTRLSPLTPDQLAPEQRELYDSIVHGPRAGAGLTDGRGALRGPFDPLLRVPTLGDVVQRVGATLRYGGTLPADVREMAILCAAAEWRCAFELEVHRPIAVDVGVPPDIVEALGRGDGADLPSGSAAELLHRAASRLFTEHRLDDDTYERLTSAFGEARTVELLVLFGYYAMLAMILETFEVRS